MRQLLMAAAAVTMCAGLLASVPAKAEYNFGPIRNGNQCWKAAPGHGRDGFGAWNACPAAARAAVPAGRTRIRNANR
jgi:hypothetical protein